LLETILTAIFTLLLEVDRLILSSYLFCPVSIHIIIIHTAVHLLAGVHYFVIRWL
jgi:hypothetical protein